MIGWFDARGDKWGRNLHPLRDHDIQKEFLKKACSLLLPSGFRYAEDGEMLEFGTPVVRQARKDGRKNVMVVLFDKWLKNDQPTAKSRD